jgi:hypothetical protein
VLEGYLEANRYSLNRSAEAMKFVARIFGVRMLMKFTAHIVALELSTLRPMDEGFIFLYLAESNEQI